MIIAGAMNLPWLGYNTYNRAVIGPFALRLAQRTDSELATAKKRRFLYKYDIVGLEWLVRRASSRLPFSHLSPSDLSHRETKGKSLSHIPVAENLLRRFAPRSNYAAWQVYSVKRLSCARSGPDSTKILDIPTLRANPC